jgi:glycosyltransferase involved in cell wall biosynthesis
MQDNVLSIVMITVPDREESFHKLESEVKRQITTCNYIHPSLGNVEIVKVDGDRMDKGGFSIGVKRQLGLSKSNGKYVCWLDDDDWISPDYIETILRLAISNADVLVFNNISRFEGFWCLVQMNLDFINDEQVKPGIIHRRPYHVCGFKRELLEGCKFPDANLDEDTGFLAQVWPKLKSQAKTEAILHEYRRLTKSLA